MEVTEGVEKGMNAMLRGGDRRATILKHFTSSARSQPASCGLSGSQKSVSAPSGRQTNPSSRKTHASHEDGGTHPSSARQPRAAIHDPASAIDVRKSPKACASFARRNQ